jgi:hypothetical protein
MSDGEGGLLKWCISFSGGTWGGGSLSSVQDMRWAQGTAISFPEGPKGEGSIHREL